MQRYTVTIVSVTATSNPVLLVPFEPSALVSRFIDELFSRLSRQNIPLAPNTHACTLHLDSETGAIIDCEDVLADVILPGDEIFAVFASVPKEEEVDNGLVASLPVRVVTPALAKRDRSELPIIRVPASITIKDLHDQIADHLDIPRTSATADNECNCTLAKKLSDGGRSSSTSFVVIHGKSKVRRINLLAPSEAGIHALLKENLGEDVSTTKHVAFHGAELSENAFDTSYAVVPVVSVCSRQRHAPQHARVIHEDGSEEQGRLLDLHTSESPINRACQDVTLKESGIAALAVDGIIDIYAVNRATTKDSGGTSGVGKSAVFRYRSHWEPSVKQSDRGIAMMLSSLRVFASNVQEMEDQHKDAIYHVFDLLSSFPPALRTLHLLIEGKTVTSSESSALSHALFEILQSYIPTEMIGTDGARLFEGARLLFGFIVEKARSVKLSQATSEHDVTATAPTSYLNAFSVVDVQDFKTMESCFDVVSTTDGPIERSLFEAFGDGGVLCTSHLKSELLRIDNPSDLLSRVALLGGGSAKEYTTFSVSHLTNNYCYPDHGQVTSAFDPSELTELEHVAAICGRNGFAVHRPAQLANAVAPCLTFDRNAHLAVYNGPQASSMPGDESGIFRPKHGNEAMDPSVVEQLIRPICARYEADGTAVFDMLGGATVRRLQAPDEVCVFAVDVSASMQSRTDFADVNEEVGELLSEDDPTAETLVEGHFFTLTSLDDAKELLGKHDSFIDIVAIVADTSSARRRRVAVQVIELVRKEFSQRIVNKFEELQELAGYGHRVAINTANVDLDRAKAFWAALKTHETPLIDFLIFRATTTPDVAARWMWYAGEDIPAGAPAGVIPSLPGNVTAVPDGLQCPISHGLMEDAVTAADGLTYSRSAITQWFSIRKSSPMTGLDLEDTTLRANDTVSASVAAWIMGGDMASRPTPSSETIKLSLKSRIGSFERDLDPATSITSLYQNVFCGLTARFTAFQLVKDTRILAPSLTSLRTTGLRRGDEITIRLADDGDMVVSANGTSAAASRASGEMCLIKVYDLCRINDHAFSYWVKRDTALTMSSVLFRFWRFKFSSGGLPSHREYQVWTDMKSQGDGFRCGTPQGPDDRLASYLNPWSCSGRLSSEPLFYEASAEDNDETFRDASVDNPLVLKVCISNAWNKKTASRQCNALSRLDVLKQMFEALINRMIAYNFKNHVGLVTFANEATVTNPISHVLENFRLSTARMSASGDTALFDALALSLDQVLEYAKQYPDAKRRIIVISDGNNTKPSRNTCEDLAYKMRATGVAVDTVCIGSEQNRDLKAISWILGCYNFHPTSLANALAICEMEPFLSLNDRPAIVSRSNATSRIAFTGSFLNAKFNNRDTVVTSDRFPARKEHQSMSDEFVQLSAKLCPQPKSTQSGPSSTFRITRVMKEIKQLATRDHPLYDVYVSESNLTFWKVVLSGPSDSPYSAGTFLLSLDMGERYPTFHPEARFITKMCHPNINAHGRVCHPLFGRDWTTDTSMSTVIDTIYGLLFQAEVSDPVSTLSTLEYHADGVEFADAVRDHVGRHAMKTREEWRVELVGELDEELSDDGDEDMSGTGEGDVSGTEEEDMSGVGEDEMSGNGEEERSDEDL